MTSSSVIISWVTRCLLTLLSSFQVHLFALRERARKIFFETRLPPGPSGRPIWGVLPYIAEPFHLFLTKHAARFGDCFSFYMGQQTMVVLSSVELIKCALKSEAFMARPKTELQNLLKGYGIVNSEGRLWRENRAFLCRMTFGAKNSGNTVYEMQNCIQRETIELLQQLRSKSDEAVNPDMLLNTTFSNVICSMVMSTRFRHDDEKFQEFMRLFDEGFKLFSDTGAMTFIPVLKYLPGTNKTLKKLRANHDKTLAFIREIVDAHKANLDPSNPKDLVDNYLIEMMDKGKDSPLFAGCADPQRQIEQVVADLFSAGVETVKTTTMWAMLYMVRNPEVMRKVQEELDSVVGCDRLPEWSDRRNLPYTHATINEIMRMSSIVATATTHSNTSPVELMGYRIPTNSHIVPNLYAVHRNPDYFADPEEFRPERFIETSESGEVTVKRVEELMPFGVGRRVCLGKILAEREVFYAVASLLHTFELRPSGEELPSMEAVPGVTLTPKPFELKFVPRNENALDETKMNLRPDYFTINSRTYG